MYSTSCASIYCKIILPIDQCSSHHPIIIINGKPIKTYNYLTLKSIIIVMINSHCLKIIFWYRIFFVLYRYSYAPLASLCRSFSIRSVLSKITRLLRMRQHWHPFPCLALGPLIRSSTISLAYFTILPHFSHGIYIIILFYFSN